MAKIYFIGVGKIKTQFWLEAVEHYRARLAKGHQLEVVVVRDGDAKLPPEARKRQEGERIQAALPPGAAWICLDEHGESLTSPSFAAYLQKLWDSSRPPCFIVGGAYGLAPEVLEKAHKKLSFGPMTMPHELAQALLWEQLFRADAIIRKTGYHHE